MANLKGVRAHGRLLPHDNVVMHISAFSSREGIKPRLIVLHDTEGHNLKGVSDLRSLGQMFENSARTGINQRSSHVATDAEGHSARFVNDEDKAWHVGNWNKWTLGIEQIGKASQASWPNAQLLETARWIAKGHRDFEIPIQHGKVRQDRLEIVRAGVIRHSELGALGGGHSDPDGSPPSGRYPFDEVLRVARGFQHLYERAHG